MRSLKIIVNNCKTTSFVSSIYLRLFFNARKPFQPLNPGDGYKDRFRG